MKTATGYNAAPQGGADLGFAVDGKDDQDKDGVIQNWTAAGEGAWDTVVKLDGKLTGARHVVRAGDGSTLTCTCTLERADGWKIHGKIVRPRRPPAGTCMSRRGATLLMGPPTQRSLK